MLTRDNSQEIWKVDYVKHIVTLFHCDTEEMVIVSSKGSFILWGIGESKPEPKITLGEFQRKLEKSGVPSETIIKLSEILVSQ